MRRPSGRRGGECEEELGIVPLRLVPLQVFFPNPGRAAWPVHLFFADGVRDGRRDGSDEAEQVRVRRMPVAELDRRIARSEVVDPSLLIARTMAGLLGRLPLLGAA